MSLWMSQNTFTWPAFANLIERDWPRGYLPRSNRRGGETLNTLW
jgi:hypothetical protein